MENGNRKEYNFLGVSQLSLRSLLIGIIGSCIITASSMYVALRMSALPWPIIFVSVLSMSILKALGKTSLNEINVAQTAMSAGAMISGGLAFTLPGLWITGIWKSTSMSGEVFWKTVLIALVGMIGGTIMTWYQRKKFIEEKALPYPMGVAAAETLEAGDAGGRKAIVLFAAMGASAIFTYFRDNLGWIPQALVSKGLYARNFNVGIWLSPMAAGIGYMIGTLYTGVWFLGAVLSYLLIIPLGTKLGIFPSVEAATTFKNTAGIGLMVGTGIGILVSYIISTIKTRKSMKKSKDSNLSENLHNNSAIRRLLVIAPALIAFILSVVCGLGPVASALLLAGIFAASAMAATITGETGINPMEIFGIIILLAVRLIVPVDAAGAFFIAAAVAVACGYAGDLLNDYKAGYILGTNPTAQLISQTAGGVVGTLMAAAAMFALIGQFGGVGPDKGLPAGQAFAVSQMVNGIGSPMVFSIAALIGITLYLVKLPAMTLGIGMYLSFEISSIVFLGGLIRFISDKVRRKKASDIGTITASGLLGGEGITGVVIAIVKMFTGA